jgi:hypothetical protein
MKTLPVLVAAILLSGCATSVPVAKNFPSAPRELLISCADLELVAENEQQLSELLKVVTENYSRYHICRAKNINWIEWYNQQKKIHDSVTKK